MISVNMMCLKGNLKRLFQSQAGPQSLDMKLQIVQRIIPSDSTNLRIKSNSVWVDSCNPCRFSMALICLLSICTDLNIYCYT